LNIKPTIGNNFDEFLSSDQFVAWELQDTIKIVDLPESRHSSICDTATQKLPHTTVDIPTKLHEV
jgi:hypothetical protein